MLKIQKVLLATDFSDSAGRALPYALFFAARHDAELHLVHAAILHADDPGHPAHHLPDEGTLEKLLEGMGMEGSVRTQRAVQRGYSAAPAILEYASDNDVDLIVLGTHGRRGVRHLLLGSVAEEVVRLAPCPVLTVRAREGSAVVPEIERIVVPIDFSEHAELGFQYAKEIAALYGAQISAIHVVEEVIYPEFYEPIMPVPTQVEAELSEQAGQHLQRTIARVAGPDVETQIEVRGGRAALQIAEFAKTEEADLIVMASHGLTGLRHFLLGSVTEQVIRRAPCPVFTVKAFGKSLL